MKLLRILLTMLAAGIFLAQPALAAELVEGKQYTRLQAPQPTAQNGKVEVVEFFWYGCPHCADFDPLLHAWVKKLPADVSFKSVPAVFNEKWAHGARLYYTLEAMDLLGKLHVAVFDAMVKQRINLADEKTLLDWIAKQGVDTKKFTDMYKSFSVEGKVRQATEMTQEYGFGGVPTVIVGGKYMPAPDVGSFPDMLRVVDGLIVKNRAEIKK